MTDQENGSASPPLDGFFYQADVSTWIALDLLVAKRFARRVTLEPAGQEDLEADLSHAEQASAATSAEWDDHRLIVQAKLRNTGPWSLADLARLVRHGKRRPSAKQRLGNARARYLLVTSAALQGEALGVGVSRLAQPGPTTLPPSLDLDGAEGRFAVLAGEDEFKIDRRLRELIEDAFRVPHVKLIEARQELRRQALDRMRRGADWTREELEALIRGWGGSVGASPELDRFTPPTNWPEALARFDRENAIILSGATGTGKTTAAAALAGHAKQSDPAAEVIEVTQAQQVLRHAAGAAAIFMIEDPWGRYRIQPGAAEWTEDLPRMLAKATPSRRFIVTSRTDILAGTGGDRKLQARWSQRLEAHHYDIRRRREIYDRLLLGLPRARQLVALSCRRRALEALQTPLAIETFFMGLAEGAVAGESEVDLVKRCLERAGRDGMEAAAADQVTTHNALAEAATMWALLKARPQLSRKVLPRIAGALAAVDEDLADGLERWVNIQVAGRNLRQSGDVLSYFHNRVEKGVEQALSAQPFRVDGTLAKVAGALIALDEEDGDGWGRETAAGMLAAARAQGRRPPLAHAAQVELDAWLSSAVTTASGAELSPCLALAAAAGSARDPVVRLARWLMAREDGFAGLTSWQNSDPPASWYNNLRAEPATAPVCDAFIRDVLPYEQTSYPHGFAALLLRLSPGSLAAFSAAAAAIVRRGHLWNAEVIAAGAVLDPTGFRPVLDAAVAYQREIAEAAPDAASWLALVNGEYDEDYAEHLGSDHDEGDTASVLIRTYVAHVRATRGWQAVAGDRHLDNLLWAWIERLTRRKAAPQKGEVEGLLKAVTGHRHENRFWDVVADHWSLALEPALVARLLEGSSDEGLRFAAAACFATAAPHLAAPLAAALVRKGDTLRALELLDDLERGGSPDDKAQRSTASSALAAGLGPKVQAAALALRSGVAAPGVAVDVLRRIDPRPNRSLFLRRARILAAAGDDVQADLLEELRDNAVADGQVGRAPEAMTIAVAAGYSDIVRSGLDHPLAAVRVRALEAIAAATPSAPLPPPVLAAVEDRSSDVRKLLVGLLADRPHDQHTALLVKLCGDAWQGYGSAYGHGTVLPIARAAAGALSKVEILTASQADDLAARIRTTEDPGLRSQLFEALAQPAATEGAERLLALALETGRDYHAEAARVLMLGPVDLPEGTIDAVDDAHLTRRPARVAAALSVAIGRWARSERLLAIADVLAGDPDRQVLLLGLFTGAWYASRIEADEVSRRLPGQVADLATSALSGSDPIPREVLHPLSSELILQGLCETLPFMVSDAADAVQGTIPAEEPAGAASEPLG